MNIPALLLYLIEILHQTTTLQIFETINKRCILSKFYIKPQQWDSRELSSCCCILSKFYIKPQPEARIERNHLVVSYRNSTSNHNYRGKKRVVIALYLIEILHQTTTLGYSPILERSLYLIEILHQTTTAIDPLASFLCCILSKFYIKPQHATMSGGSASSCILSKFYIKPQHHCYVSWCFPVVSYRNSTSNHNLYRALSPLSTVVSYRNSTSNHNYRQIVEKAGNVVSYRNSTSNHNDVRSNPLAVPVVSYRNSTSNHNERAGQEPHHKVVSYRNSTSNHNSRSRTYTSRRVVSYRNSTSNHN